MSNNKPLSTIFMIVFISLFGFGVILPLLPFIAEEYHASPFQIGLLSSAYSLMQFIAAPILGQLSDRYGRKKLLIISQLGSVAGFILLGLANNLTLIFISRMIDGITGGNISIAQAYIADITTKKDRARGMGIIGAAFGLGFIFGPAIGGLLAKYGFWAPAFFAAAISLITAFLTQTFLKETVNTSKAIKSPRTKLSVKQMIDALKTAPLKYFIIAFFVVNLAFSLFQGIFAIWGAETYSFGPTENGYLFAYIGLLAAVVQLKVLPFCTKRLSERKILIGAVPILAGGLFLMVMIKTVTALYFGLALLGLGNGLGGPVLQSLASENVNPQDYGETLGILQSSGSVGRIFGPALGGEMFNTIGKNSPFYFSSVILGFVGMFLIKATKPIEPS